MIVRRVELRHFRKHNASVVYTFDERMTIVYGANEGGKSTLFQALEYAFFRRSGSSGADILELAPWDTSGLRPAVSVDFSHGGVEYRLEKAWGTGNHTLLSKLDAAGLAKPFMADEADDFVTAIFSGEPPGKGAFSGFQARHLGLAHLLFAPQGHIPILGDGSGLAQNANARARLSQAIGAAGQTEREARISQQIKKEYNALFKSGGLPRTNAPSRPLEAAALELDGEIACVTIGLRNLETLALALREAEAAGAVRAANAAAAQASLLAERPRFMEAVTLKGVLDQAQRSFEAAVKAYEEAVERKRAIEQTRESLAIAEEHDRGLAAALREREAALRETSAARDAALTEWNAAAAEDPVLAAWRRELEEANRAELLRGEREKLALQQHDIAAFDSQIAEKSRENGALPQIAEATISELERLIKRSRDLEAQLDAARTRVTFTPERTVAIRWSAAGIEQPEIAAAGKAAEFTATGPIRLEIEGVGALEARGPVADIAAAQLELEGIHHGIASIEAAVGTRDAADLRVARARAGVLHAEIAGLKAARSQRLAGAGLAEITARIASIDAALAAAASAIDRGALGGQIAERERASAAGREAASTAHKRCELAVAVESERRDQARKACTNLKELSLAPLRSNLARLLANESDEERAAQLSAAYLRHETAQQSLEQARNAYAPFADLKNPEILLAECQAKADLLAGLAREADRTCTQLRANLEAQRKGEPSAALSEFQERRERVERKLERAQTDERALKLLYELVKSSDEQRIAGFAAPVLARVGPWFERVFGRTLNALALSEDHAMENLHVEGVDQAIGVKDLSVGALDQLGLLIRLGYASLLTAPDRLGRMPVLLDDPLVNADELRRKRLIAIFKELAEQAQLIIFTCRPEDYEGANAPMLSIAGVEAAIPA